MKILHRFSSQFIAKSPFKRSKNENSPRIQIVVSLIDRLRHFFHACGVVLLIDRYQLLSELIKKLDMMFVLMQLGVERLRGKERLDEIVECIGEKKKTTKLI